MNINRRNFLKGTAAGAAGTALAGGVLIGGAHADADAATNPGPVTEESYPFHGPHQSGVLTPRPSGKQAFTCVASFDSIHHAIRDITKHTRAGVQLTWKMEGYNSPPALPARRGTCSASRTAPPTRPAPWRAT